MAVQEHTYIYRLTHYQNLPFILQHGLHAANGTMQDPHFVNIGYRTLIYERKKKQVPVAPGGRLPDYVPFLFCPKPVMLFPIAKGNVPDYKGTQEEIVYLIGSAQVVAEANVQFVFTNRHARLDYAQFFNNLNDLQQLDWNKIREENWGLIYDETKATMEIKQAEFLVHMHLPKECIKAITCANENIHNLVQPLIQQSGLHINLHCKPTYYY